MHTAAEIVITRPLFVAWSWATPQAGYRVRVYSDGPATFDVLAYSSGVVASSHPVHAVPAGVLGNQRTYWLIVDTYGIDGSVGQSEFVQFDIDWALCGAPANFAAAPVGGDCTGDPSVLPVIRLTWDPVTAVARAAEIDAALTLSGNEITDASRQTGLQGDGREVQDSTAGIWQPSTNIASQSGFEALLSSWAAGGTGVLSLSGDAKFGVASGRLVVAGGGGTLGQVFTRTNGLPLTVSLWAKAVDGVRPFVVSIYDNVAATIRKQATFVPSTSAWTRFVLTASSAEMTAATAFTLFLAPVDVDAEILFDGVQIEQLSIATPYIEVPATTPQSRAAARVQIPMTGMTGTQGWVAARVRVGWANGATDTPGGSRRLWEWGDDANNRFELSYVAAGNTWDMLRRAGGAGTLITQGAGTFSPGDWVLVIGRWTNLTFGISLDGAPFTDGGEANPLTLAAVLADLGTAPLAAGGDTTILSGDLDWVAMGTGTLTDSDAATLYGLLYEPRLCDMTAALGDAAAPLIMWNALDGVAQYTAPVVFEGYDVLRRALPQETAWTRIGVLTDRLNGRFDDAGVNSDQPYEYTVSWRGSDGSFSMTSLESVARIEQQGFDWLWVHKAVDSSLNMRLLSVEHETSVDQDVALIPIWGAAHPIAQFGEQVATTIHVRSGPGKMDAPSEWQELLAFLADQQDDGAVYCVRFGRAQEMYYAVAVTPKLAAHLADYDVDVEFREVDFDVSVPLGGV